VDRADERRLCYKRKHPNAKRLEKEYSHGTRSPQWRGQSAVRGPQEVINDPQLRANGIVVPLEGAGVKLSTTISSPIQVRGIAKVPARRGPELGEQLGFKHR
jgi:hypothetical protein